MEIKRDLYLNQLILRKHNPLIKVITGIRRCGKSYLLFELFKKHLLSQKVNQDHIIEMSFDDFDNQKFQDPSVFFPYVKEKLKDDKMYYILLDEVQLLKDFEYVLNSFLKMKNVDVYVTGSNAKFLSKDIITEFRGRGDEIHLYPLNFSEFMSTQKDILSGWKDYTTYGGLPLITSFKTHEQKTSFLTSIFTETYIKDIVGRHRIRNKSELDEILNILSSSIGSLTNPSKLSRTFKSIKNKDITPNTIKQYIEYFTDSFLIDKALKYDIKGKKYINTPLKYYFTDIGLRNARINFRQTEESHLMENIIFNELKIRKYSVDVGTVISNEIDKNGSHIRKSREIDFVCNLGSKRYYIQSALSISDKKKLDQELKSLSGTKDEFKKIVITQNNLSPYYNDQGILILDLFDFLLNEKSLEY